MIMGYAFWSSRDGEIMQVPSEQLDRIKNIDFDRTSTSPVADMIRREVERLASRVGEGEMHVVELKAEPEGYTVMDEPPAQIPKTTEPKKDSIGYTPDFTSFDFKI